MSNTFGSNQNNPQLAGTNIVGVNPGNAQQKDAQAMQRVSQGQIATGGAAGMTNAAYGGASGLSANFTASGLAGSAGNSAGMNSSAGMGGAAGMNSSAGMGGAAGMNSAAGMGGAAGMNSATYTGSGFANSAFAGGAAGQNQNNPQLVGTNIVGVNPGNGPQKDAQAVQRVSQQPLG